MSLTWCRDALGCAVTDLAAGLDLPAVPALLHMLLQPAILFVGERFESDQDFKLAKSMLLDMFRGQQVRAAAAAAAALLLAPDIMPEGAEL
jgi:hypothetical protein